MIPLVALSIAFSILPIHAEVSIGMYETAKMDERFGLNLEGVGIGYQMANYVLTRSGQRPLYCQPPNVALTRRNLLQMLDSYLTRPSTQSTLQPQSSVEYFFLKTLQDAFPCQ